MGARDFVTRGPGGHREPLGEGASDLDLESSSPHYPWREPLFVLMTSGLSGLACRYCMVRAALRGSSEGVVPMSRSAWEKHIADEHPRP